MLSKLLICLVLTALFAVSTSLNSLDRTGASVASFHPVSARPGGSVWPVNLQKRADASNQACDPNAMSWYAMVVVYATTSLGSIMTYLNSTFLESGMEMGGFPKLASSPYDPDRVWCEFFPRVSDKVGTSFPRCLLETAIDDFCTVTEDTWMNSTHPMSTNNRGGRWTTYKFTGYSISGLYVGAEFSKLPECKDHQRGLYAYNNTPDRRCKEKLLGQVVDRCKSLWHRSLFPLHFSSC